MEMSKFNAIFHPKLKQSNTLKKFVANTIYDHKRQSSSGGCACALA